MCKQCVLLRIVVHRFRLKSRAVVQCYGTKDDAAWLVLRSML